MKKLLVLTLVLGIASLASAGYSLVHDGGTGVTVEGADNTANAITMHLIYADVATAAFPTLEYTGDGSAVTDNSAAAASFEGFLGLDPGAIQSIYLLELKDTVEPFLEQNGLLVSSTIASVTGTVYLLDAAGGGIDTLVIPEPATMALMALGGLLLRRKK